MRISDWSSDVCSSDLLQHHVFADPLAMLCEVLRDGMMMILDPSPGERATPYWCYCFDHGRYISAFAAGTEHPVILHDFKARETFPGWRILDRVEIGSASCRERVCRYVYIPGCAVLLK